MKLVIVESPAKAKTINKYLGPEFKVVASFGHIKDLPSKPGSVLPDENFKMKYVVSDKSRKYVTEIVKLAKQADEIYLATDPDREGEAISWHIVELLKEKKITLNDANFKRIAFNEITKSAVTRAVTNPRNIDTNLVNAQQARRALDYLVGFTLSPILWRKLPGCRSAGRVQSVALRLICEREDEIDRFVSEEYWDISLDMSNTQKQNFVTKLTHINDKKLEKFSIQNQTQASDIKDKLSNQNFVVDKIEKKQQKRNPSAPFITSSLQQEASRKLGFGAKKTMQLAQKLYEGIDLGGETVGLITYMRTDGVTLAQDAMTDIRELILNKYGDNYVSPSPRIYKSRAKNAQEAHEAIRPTNIKLLPNDITDKLDRDQWRLYDLIWKRTIASQMENVVMNMVGINFISADRVFTARATGSTISFDGFYKVYQEGVDDQKEEDSKMLPPMEQGEFIEVHNIDPQQHFTEHPPRYSEASLVKRLEELGIGRPSTYASIISVLQDRKYAVIDKKRFYPNDFGRFVTSFLIGFFEKYVEYDFTAELESNLDKIAEGSIEWKELLSDFWTGFYKNVDEVSAQPIGNVIHYVEQSLKLYLFGREDSPEYSKNTQCSSCNKGTLHLKLGKYGAFLACNQYPDCEFKKQVAHTDDTTDTQDLGLVNNSKELGVDNNNNIIYLKKGPYGWYVQSGDAKSKKDKPKRSSIPNGVNIQTVELDYAQKLLSLPLHIGNHTETKEAILIGIGKFGPYVKYQARFISIPKDLDPFVIDIEQAMDIILNSKKKFAKSVKTKTKNTAKTKS